MRLGQTTVPARWLDQATIRHHRKGALVLRAGSILSDWIAISAGCVRIDSIVAADTKVAFATLWAGDVIGRRSPIGTSIAHHDVVALVDTTTLAMPAVAANWPQQGDERDDETEQLNLASAARLHRQVSMRLAGNGMQNLVRVLATLAQALAPIGSHDAIDRVALPVPQAIIGELAGISRRQAWIYLGQLAEAGWVETARTRITLLGAPAWLRLLGMLESRGLDGIATIDKSIELLGGIALPQRSVA